MSIFTGVGVAMITPFDSSGINFDCFGKIIDYLIDSGVDMLCVCGTTGEPPTMSDDEKIQAIDFTVKKVAGRVPVVAGVGCNCTADTIVSAQKAEQVGIDGLLIVTPYYNKCTQNGIVAHYSAIAKSVSTPIIVYNVPGRTGVNIAPQTVAKLADIDGIVGIKEASGNIAHLQEVIRLVGDKMDVYLGDDALTYVGMALGAKGVISVCANVAPKQMSVNTSSMLAGDFEQARKMQFTLNPLIKSLFCEVNPIPVKKGMNLLGFDAGSPRLPLTEMEDANALRLEKDMRDLGLIK